MLFAVVVVVTCLLIVLCFFLCVLFFFTLLLPRPSPNIRGGVKPQQRRPEANRGGRPVGAAVKPGAPPNQRRPGNANAGADRGGKPGAGREKKKVCACMCVIEGLCEC